MTAIALSTRRGEPGIGGIPTPKWRLAALPAKASTSDRFVTAVMPIKPWKEDTMRGLPLTPQEAVASVARRARGLENQGLDRGQAVRHAAAETGIDPQKVRWCLETVFPHSAVRRAPASRRRRGALAMAAAI